MTQHKLYSLSIGYFLLFVVALLLTGIALFLLELGVKDSATFMQIIGNIKPKSIEGMIEIFSPHIMAMGLMLFVLAHFMLFSTKYAQAFSLKVFMALAIVILLDQSAYFFISIGWEVFGWVKVFALFLFASLLSLLVWMVATSL